MNVYTINGNAARFAVYENGECIGHIRVAHGWPQDKAVGMLDKMRAMFAGCVVVAEHRDTRGARLYI